MRARQSLAIALALSCAGASVAVAQQKGSTFDRSVVPAARKTPDLHVPAWTKTTLPNGAQLIVSEKRDLPLVSVTISFVGGARQFEPADKTGVADLFAQMLTEGTSSKTGDQISNAMQLLGTHIGATINDEDGNISFVAMKDKLEPALALAADIMMNPSFPAAALERRRAAMLVDLEQRKDVTADVANDVLPKTLYTTRHPYGRVADEQSVKAIKRADLSAFHRQFFQPRRATITVVGDVKPDEVKTVVERVLGNWTSSGPATVAFTYPPVTPPASTTIYLVDKSDAAQSSFAIGTIGPPRNTPDYFALRVMNMLFGELFQSRLNANIREAKGYSYGVGSGFAFGKGPGPFNAGGDIVTAKTDSALIEFMKEIRGIRGDRPLTDEEMESAKAALVQRLPSQFSSVAGVGSSITALYLRDLPEDYYQRFAASVNAVTKEDVVRVARKYIDPDHLAIVIVGDRKEIQKSLEALKIAPIVLLDVNGNPMKETVRP